MVQFNPATRAVISTPDNPSETLPTPGMGTLITPLNRPSAIPNPMEM
jgi:hypothetical protein